MTQLPTRGTVKRTVVLRSFARTIPPGRDARNVAVSDQAGDTTFAHVRNAPGWSGLQPYEDIGVEHPDIESVTVRTVRLDDDLPVDYVPALIKIDVNGAEAQTLRGVKTISAHRPTVVFEHGRAAQAYGTTPEMIFELLSGRCGLRIFDLEGHGPFDVPAFCEAARTRWNFVALP